MRNLVTCLVVLLLAATSPALAGSGWKRAKNVADDIIYAGKDRTFYCGCVYTSHGDDDGSGDVDHQACGYQTADKWQNVANSIQWEHIVPASLMPARDFDCWALGGRGKCEREDPRAQGMLFDLHNLAPSIGQVNQYRRDDRYTELGDEGAIFGQCPARDKGKAFEPPDCLKGDVARVWLYMSFRHGVVIPQDERDMFEEWVENDPVSPWESEREDRIFKYTFVHNPLVDGVTPDPAGACPWE